MIAIAIYFYDYHTKFFILRFTVYKDADLMDFINAPIGKGLPIAQQLRPLICGKDIHVL